jgi:hypothetical protein
MLIVLKKTQDMEVQGSDIGIRFFTNPLKFLVSENGQPGEQYLVPEDIEVDSKLLLQFSMNCSRDRKDFYFMGKHIFSLENSVSVERILFRPDAGFETKHFMVSEGNKCLQILI